VAGVLYALRSSGHLALSSPTLAPTDSPTADEHQHDVQLRPPRVRFRAVGRLPSAVAQAQQDHISSSEKEPSILERVCHSISVCHSVCSIGVPALGWPSPLVPGEEQVRPGGKRPINRFGSGWIHAILCGVGLRRDRGRVTEQFTEQSAKPAQANGRKPLILKTRRDVRVVEGARLENVLDSSLPTEATL
jgi:hypothetical protein